MSDDPLLLVADNDSAVFGLVTEAAERVGLRVASHPGGRDVLNGMALVKPDAILVDLMGANGAALVGEIYGIDPHCAVILMAGEGRLDQAIAALKAGALDYLTKPADADQILAAFKIDQPPDDTPSGGADDVAPAIPSRPMSLERVEWEHINRVMVECGGNITHAARMLRMHRRSLQRKLAKYPVSD